MTPKETASVEALERRHARFLSALTHELRTPLGSVMMLAEMIIHDADGGGETTARSVSRAKKIHLAALDMRELIGQAAQLARIESGRAPLDQTVVSVDSLPDRLARAILEHTILRRAPEIGVDDGTPATLRTDRRLLTEVVRYLVDGIAADEDQAVTIALRPAGSASGDAAGLAIDVHDPDLTLDAGQLEALFEPFQQTLPGARGRHGGQGLGLTIARALARHLGGSLEARQPAAGGLTLRLVLPLDGA